MKKLLFILLLATMMYGQRSDTIYFPAFTNAVATGTSTVTNIGQSYHLLTVTATNAPAHVCAVWGANGRIELQGSYDNLTWVRIGQPINALVTNYSILTWGYGAFPYVRVNYISGDTVNCAITVTYTGSLYGTKVTPVFDSTVKNGFAPSSFTTVGAGDLTVFTCGNFTKNVSVYQYNVNNTTAGTLTGNVIKIVDSTATNIDTLLLGSIPTLGSRDMHSDAIPLIGSNQGAPAFLATPPVSVVVASSAAGLTGYILARCE